MRPPADATYYTLPPLWLKALEALLVYLGDAVTVCVSVAGSAVCRSAVQCGEVRSAAHSSAVCNDACVRARGQTSRATSPSACALPADVMISPLLSSSAVYGHGHNSESPCRAVPPWAVPFRALPRLAVPCPGPPRLASPSTPTVGRMMWPRIHRSKGEGRAPQSQKRHKKRQKMTKPKGTTSCSSC